MSNTTRTLTAVPTPATTTDDARDSRDLLDACDNIAQQAVTLRQRIEHELDERQRNREATVTPQLLTAHQAATYLSIGVSSLYRLVQAGDIAAVRIAAKTTRYRRVDLDSYIDRLADATNT